MKNTEIKYTIYAEFEDVPVRGNAMCSGDPVLDKEVEDAILKRLDDNDVWAWASVRVTAEVNGGGHDLIGEDFLGCCTYDSVEDFKKCDYYESMCFDALRDLVKQLRRAHGDYEELPEYVKGNYQNEEAMEEAKKAQAEYEQLEQEAVGEIYQDTNCFE